MLNRRQFLCGLSAASITALGPRSWQADVYADTLSATEKPCLQGFIVSDAHFGWDNAQQPDPEEQRRAMERILKRFPYLDLFIDTGDAYHGNLRGADGEEARHHWLDIIANAAGALPFFYIPGNHEIIGARDGDHEDLCCRLGSMPCRPYYSFDIKGIHFVSVPEMIRAIYVTQETLEWLALDLRVHRDKTTVLLSHNNITGTTGPFEDGYRGVVNSEVLLRLFADNPQVIAWMHGHNHNYEMVDRDSVLYVSNGRIGGFDPSHNLEEGSHGLGGIFFAITEAGLAVRSYSATRDCFLDTLGIDNVAADMCVATTMTPNAPSAMSYGYGGARDGQRIPVKHHIVGEALTRTLHLAGVEGDTFNDDPNLSLYAARHAGAQDRPPQQMLMACEVRGSDVTWHWDAPGITLAPSEESGQQVLVAIPRGSRNQVAYYRCAPGKSYLCRIHVTAEETAGAIEMQGRMTDTRGNTLYESDKVEHMLTDGAQHILLPLEVPAAAHDGTIYTDESSDIQTQLAVDIAFAGLVKPVRIERVELLFTDASQESVKPGVRMGGELYRATGALSKAEVMQFTLPSEKNKAEMVECVADGNQRVTWLLRETCADVQVRNAVACLRNGWLEIGPIRADWLEVPVIMLASLVQHDYPWPVRLYDISALKMRRRDGMIEFSDMKHGEKATVTFHTEKQPGHIEGGELLESEAQRVHVRVHAEEMRVSFG